MASQSSTLDQSEHGRELLQGRIALAGLFGFCMGGGFFVYRLIDIVARAEFGHFSDPSLWFHLGGAGCLFAMWVLCRRGARTPRFVHTVEAICVVGASAGYIAMGAYIPPVGRADFIVLLALSYGLIARAAYVPSTPKRTAALTTAVAVPAVVMTYIVMKQLNIDNWRLVAPEIAESSAAEAAAGLTMFNAAWWICAIALCTLTTRVIYGLRTEVRNIRKLGQYTLHKKLGEGGMGVVYLASHAMLRRPTAVKLLPLEKAGERTLARFEREVQITAQLSHPNTVTIHDYGHTPEGVFYYAMELLDGATLGDIVDLSGPLPPSRVARILDQVAGALAEAHGVGLIHRDIKPANIMMLEQGGVPDVAKVVDFGLVKELSRGGNDVNLTQVNTITGTPQFLSPEAIRSPEAVDARSDLYALGAVAYFMLTGTHVFQSATVLEVCSDHLHAQPIPPSERLGAEVPAELERLVLDCLAKDPADRPQTALELQTRVRGLELAETWTEDDARQWWDRYRRHDDSPIKDRDRAASDATIEVDLLGRTDKRQLRNVQ